MCVVLVLDINFFYGCVFQDCGTRIITCFVIMGIRKAGVECIVTYFYENNWSISRMFVT